MPELTPVTVPDVPTVATPVAVLLQVPPVMASLNEVVPVPHMVAVPLIEVGVVGKGLTVTTVVAAALPQVLVIV